MVNCKNCGAPLSLEDAYCPHCGTPNPEAQEHLEKLAQLDKAFKQAENEVHDEVKRSRKGYGLLVVLVMVLLANLAMIPLHAATYEFADRAVLARKGKANVKEALDELLEEGEYIEVDVYADKFNLSYNDYGEYNRIAYLADIYSRIIQNMTIYLYGSDPYYDPLVRTIQYIKDFDDAYSSYVKRGSDPEIYVYMKDLHDEYVSFLKVYMKLTDEDIDQISDMSNSDLLLRVNERMNDEKE